MVALSNNASVVKNSAVNAATIDVNRTTLRSPAVVFDSEDTERGDTIEISKLVDYGDMPVGARIYYTTDGSDPGSDGNGNPLSGTLYTGAFDPLHGPASGRPGLWSTRASTHRRSMLGGFK